MRMHATTAHPLKKNLEFCVARKYPSFFFHATTIAIFFIYLQ
jgi:hypothetical protein